LARDLVIPVAVLVVAKAPVPGLAKTRLAADVGDRLAADIAAAALLDTLDAVAAAAVRSRVVALTGDVDAASGSADLTDRLADFIVVAQRGADFAERLANAHADAARATGLPVLQIGMDTPQVTDELISHCARELMLADAVLGLADDGGWWVLGVTEAQTAECLRDVPMSRADTGAVTLRALRDTGLHVTLVETLTDVDTVADVPIVRSACASDSRFARVTEGMSHAR
jgi:glycosyltransferase A (GT-A) superfamily protein (DUF2064 family)